MPAIWSRDTGQRITCFDRCHLIIAGMSSGFKTSRRPPEFRRLLDCMSPATLVIKPGFHMSGKSQTIGDFTFCRLSQILPIYQIFARGLSQIFEKRYVYL